MDKTPIDILWIVLCAGLVFCMQIGFLCLESGLTRSKNAINVAVKNISDLGIAVVLYWLFGFGLMFGASYHGWLGTDSFLLSFDHAPADLAAIFLFQAMFCTTAATIMSGAAAERMRFKAYLVVTLFIAGLIYPVFGHWVWGGLLHSQPGWLEAKGFIDFAGSSVVHSVGGWVALAVIMIIGPRQGRFDPATQKQPMPASSLPLAMTGALLLAFGWFGFNGGSTLALDERVPSIIVNTLIAAVAGLLCAIALSQSLHGYISAEYPLNGMIAGLVAITASAHVVSVGSAFVIGFIGSLAMVGCTLLLTRWRIDDAVGAVPAHLAAGIWGTLAVALFAIPGRLTTGLDRVEQFWVQLQGVVFCGLWAFGLTYVLLRVFNHWFGMRIDPEGERLGLNVSEHGARTELNELLTAMEEQAAHVERHREVPVEPFTEVGQIAAQYNRVIRALHVAMDKTQAVVRDIRDGIITFREDGLITSFNPGAEKLFQVSANDATGKMVGTFLRDPRKPVAGCLPQHGGEIQREMQCHRADETPFVAEIRISHGLDESGHYTCMVRDITERREMENQLLQEKMLAQVTLASIGDGVITTDQRARITYLNPVAEDLTGWSSEAAYGRPLQDVYAAFSEASGESLHNPVVLALRGKTVSSAQGAVAARFLRRRDGREFPIQDAVAAIRDPEGRVIGTVLSFRDVSITRQLADELSHQAAHDALTGLVNRTEFERRLAALLQPGKSQAQHVLCYMDLDQFKIVNDTCGHTAGDELLRQLTGLLKTGIRTSDVLARLGGDEFGLLLIDCPLAQANDIAEELRTLVEKFRFAWDDMSFAVGVSIGLVAIEAGTSSLAPLLSAADSACYAAKDAGRNRIHVFQPDDQELLARKGEMQWVSRIRDALDADRLRLYLQPIVSLQQSNALPRYEILVRMVDPDGTVIPPGAFMPAAERYDLSNAIDRWVVSNALAWIGDNVRRCRHPLGSYAINLSAASLSEENFLEFLLQRIAQHRIPPEHICFEITETSAIAKLSSALTLINELRAVGCKFALDDFGSGLSSFAYLKNLPVDYLKIDGIFVKDIDKDPVARALVTSINNVGHEMGLQTVAEFVESAAIQTQLRAIGVDFAQGYHIGRPQPLELLSEARVMPR